MGKRRRAVVSADPTDLRAVEQLVDRGRYATVSQFVRLAVAEKLARERAAALAEQVDAYVRAGHADEDADLIAAQALDGARPRATRKKRRAEG